MNKDEQIKILQDVVRIESVLSREAEVADYLEKLFKDAGIETRRINHSEGRDNLIATLKGDGEGPVLGLCGHMDVVPVGDVEWEHGPFSADIVDGQMYGRGTSDMKAGLVACALAMIELKNSGAKFNGTIKFIATVGEETSGIGAEQVVGLGEADDLDALIIAEPSSGKEIAIAHKGALWPRITTYGKTAHGSAPHLGVNAVDYMIALVKGIKENLDMSAHEDEIVGKPTMSLNKFEGGKATNVIPDTCVVEFDIRTVATQDHSDIKKIIEDQIAKLEKELPDFKADVEYINDLYAVRTDVNDGFVKTAKDVSDKVFGGDIIFTGLSGYTDASHFVKSENKFPIIIFGPGNIKLAHQPNESVDVEEYATFINVYQEIAKAFLG